MVVSGSATGTCPRQVLSLPVLSHSHRALQLVLVKYAGTKFARLETIHPTEKGV